MCFDCQEQVNSAPWIQIFVADLLQSKKIEAGHLENVPGV
jgi:hypothetical protein